MGLFCSLGKHRLPTAKIWNQGRYFGRCPECDASLVQVGRDWAAIPKGYQVVWRPRTAADHFAGTIIACRRKGRVRTTKSWLLGRSSPRVKL